jgi:type VI secretion system protein
MARETSLFDRLSRPAGSGLPSVGEAKAGAVQAVLENLQRLLNSRQGHAAAQMGYGIPDPSEVLHQYSDAITQMAKAIKASIEKYEPRLTAVQVRHVANPDDILTLRYQIVGQLAKSKERVPVVFDTHVDPCGRIRVMS